jgi:diguanylate cyclase (GGDEF)-like protein
VDIDHFKSINDRHGHEVGDQALRFVAERISAACRAGDLAARQGGEEFVVLFSDVDAKHALDAAERIREAVAQQPFEHGGTPLPITVSIGLTLFARSEHALDDGLRRADAALYQSKSAGRNRTTVLLA